MTSTRTNPLVTVSTRLRSLSALDREVLGWWVLTRIGLLLIGLTAPFLFGEGDPPPITDRWRQWDFWHFDRIAMHGYFEPGWRDPVEAFFPGLPLLLRAGTWLGAPTVVVGMVISFVAGGIAAVALARLAEREFGPDTGRYAALAWMVAPPAVFLAAPYTESLFLAFAIPAWLAARQGRWPLAGVLAAGSCAVRVSGLFLTAALVVEFVTSRRRRWRSLPWLALPAAPVLAYMTYLWVNTGDWLRWYNAQAQNWHRGFNWPQDALVTTWDAAFGGGQSPNFMWMFRAELVAMVVGIVLTVVLIVHRRWGEAAWIGIQVAAFATSAWFFSVPRATLLWFPLWMLIGTLAAGAGRPAAEDEAEHRHRGSPGSARVWWWRAYLAVSVPLFGVWAAAYLVGRWAG